MTRLTSLPAIRRARDEATRRVIIEHLREHGSVPAAAEALGCARETLQPLAEHDAAFGQYGASDPCRKTSPWSDENCHR